MRVAVAELQTNLESRPPCRHNQSLFPQCDDARVLSRACATSLCRQFARAALSHRLTEARCSALRCASLCRLAPLLPPPPLFDRRTRSITANTHSRTAATLSRTLIAMPKLDKPKGKAVAAARSSASAGLSKSASSKKKKKTAAGAAHHAASLGEDLDKLANPGKLKPIVAKSGDAKARKAGGKEEQKLDNQLLLATKLGSKSKKSAQLYGSGEGDMEDERDEADEPDFGEDDDEDAEAEMAPIPARMSKKILDSVHKQQQEELGGEGMEEEAAGGAGSSARRLKTHLVNLSAQDAADLDDNFDDDDGEDYGVNEGDDASGGDDDVELSMEDQQSLELFMPKSNTLKAKSMAEAILARIQEKEAEAAASGAGSGFAPAMTHGSNVKFGAGFGASSSLAATFGLPSGGDAAGDLVRSKLNPKVAEVYTKVGKFLSHYTSGKIPKAFKVIPNLRSWEEVLFLTAPDSWSPQAHLVATRIFASNFNPKMAQRFFSLVLLPKVRSDIERNKSLNFHLYQAIKKSLYKPAAFFKGILLPVAEEGATVREAVILSSILAKCTIPVLHSSVALLKLAQMPFSGTSCLFLKTLLNKKYSLPVKVVAALVQFFCRFQSGGASLGAMPLIWHQTLLAFVQRYKFELSANQITAIKNLVKVQNHHAVTPEIRREMMAITQAQQQGMVPAVGQFQFVSMPNGAPLSSNSSLNKPAGFPQAPAPAFTSLAASLQNPQSFSMSN